MLVYAHDASAGAKQQRARVLLERLWETGEGCLSVQVLQEFFVVVTRRTRRVLEPRQAAAIVSDFARWTVHAPLAGDVVAAIELHRGTEISFWDAMVLRSAARLPGRLVRGPRRRGGVRWRPGTEPLRLNACRRGATRLA